MDGDQRSPQRLERGIRGLKGVADSAGQCSVEIHFRYTSKTVRAVSQAVVYLAYLFHSTIAPEQDQSVSQPLLWLEGLLLISKHIQEAFSHRNRAKSTQLLGLVCGLKSLHLELEAYVAWQHFHKASEHSQCMDCGGSCFEFSGSEICRSRLSPLDA